MKALIPKILVLAQVFNPSKLTTYLIYFVASAFDHSVLPGTVGRIFALPLLIMFKTHTKHIIDTSNRNNDCQNAKRKGKMYPLRLGQTAERTPGTSFMYSTFVLFLWACVPTVFAFNWIKRTFCDNTGVIIILSALITSNILEHMKRLLLVRDT